MLIDYGKPPRTLSLTSIESRPVEIVQQHKFHGIVCDNRLTFEREGGARLHNERSAGFTACAGFSIDRTHENVRLQV